MCELWCTCLSPTGKSLQQTGPFILVLHTYILLRTYFLCSPLPSPIHLPGEEAAATEQARQERRGLNKRSYLIHLPGEEAAADHQTRRPNCREHPVEKIGQIMQVCILYLWGGVSLENKKKQGTDREKGNSPDIPTLRDMMKWIETLVTYPNWMARTTIKEGSPTGACSDFFFTWGGNLTRSKLTRRTERRTWRRG